MLRKIRIVVAALVFIAILLLFCDFTWVTASFFNGSVLQFVPALLALNFVVVISLVIVTFVFGRLYCSVICPLGIFQDISSWLGGKFKKNRFSYRKPHTILRYIVLAVFIVLWIAGLPALAMLIEPYSAFGRMASELFSPVYRFGNNILANISESMDGYMFSTVDIFMKSVATFVVAAVTFLGLGFLSWRHGRLWCNSICPVGSVLGLISGKSLFRPVIHKEKCVGCGLCSKNCKACCIDHKAYAIDSSRCVTCMNCLSVCRKGAIQYEFCSPFASSKTVSGDENAEKEKSESRMAAEEVKPSPAVAEATENPNVSEQGEATSQPMAPDASEVRDEPEKNAETDQERRAFFVAAPAMGVMALAQIENNLTDGGLARIVPKESPERETPLVPAGAQSLKHLARTCVGCQLCIAQCPNHVLTPSTDLRTLMQPRMTFDKGYCRPECVRCGEVCPAGAIEPVTRELKSATQVGYAVLVPERCIAYTEGVHCRNCMRHCPTGAIKMTPKDPSREKSPRIPVIDIERCIGCGACEHLCPVRPLSGIVVEGRETHRVV